MSTSYNTYDFGISPKLFDSSLARESNTTRPLYGRSRNLLCNLGSVPLRHRSFFRKLTPFLLSEREKMDKHSIQCTTKWVYLLAALYVSSRAASICVAASAIWNCIPWNSPIGFPNCLR